MRNILKRLLISNENSHNNYDRIVFETQQNYIPLSSNSESAISTKLYLFTPFHPSLSNPDTDTANFYEDFNSDTSIKALGGLSIWQFTAVLIASILGIVCMICLVRRVAFCFFTQANEHEDIKRDLDQYVSISTTYSMDSCDPLNKAQ